MTSSLNLWLHHSNNHVFELHMQIVTCVKISKFVLAFTLKNTRVFSNTAKQAVYNEVFLNIITPSSKISKI